MCHKKKQIVTDNGRNYTFYFYSVLKHTRVENVPWAICFLKHESGFLVQQENTSYQCNILFERTELLHLN